MISYSILLLKWFCMLLRSSPPNWISDVWVSNNLQLVHISVDIQTKHIGNIINNWNIIELLPYYCNIAILLHLIYSAVNGIFTILVYQLALCALIQYNIVNIINTVQYICFDMADWFENAAQVKEKTLLEFSKCCWGTVCDRYTDRCISRRCFEKSKTLLFWVEKSCEWAFEYIYCTIEYTLW